jgi:hypothetical protein
MYPSDPYWKKPISPRRKKLLLCVEVALTYGVMLGFAWLVSWLTYTGFYDSVALVALVLAISNMVRAK